MQDPVSKERRERGRERGREKERLREGGRERKKENKTIWSNGQTQQEADNQENRLRC
jgi:hypothetical protein